MMTTSSASSSARGKSKVRKVIQEPVQYSGPSYSGLPNTILENIFARLTIKLIILCKCVCKTWNDVISEPEFAKLHFEQAQMSPLIRSSEASFASRMVYLVQPDEVEFEHKLDMCDHRVPHRRFQLCQINVEIDTKLKLPLRNIEMILDDANQSGRERNKAIKLKMNDHKYDEVTSCNGLLCLSDPYDNDPLAVCNPVTGEFINLPEARTARPPLEVSYYGLHKIESGFGCGRTTNQYKVVRMFRKNNSANASTSTPDMVAEVHVLGTNFWKNTANYSYTSLKFFPTYLNGCIYWLAEQSVICFDIDTEQFDSVLSPLYWFTAYFDHIVMGAFGGELCISVDLNDKISLLVLKENGTEKNWSKLFSICKHPGIQQWPRGSFLPIIYMSNGALLMFNSHTGAFIYKDPKKIGYRYLKVRGVDSKLEVIPHIPSLVSLKGALSGQDPQILNINSGCGKLKIYKEARGVSLVEDMVVQYRQYQRR